MIPVKKIWQKEITIRKTEEASEGTLPNNRIYTIVKLLIVGILCYVIIFM
jgi:hypothetical protein